MNEFVSVLICVKACRLDDIAAALTTLAKEHPTVLVAQSPAHRRALEARQLPATLIEAAVPAATVDKAAIERWLGLLQRVVVADGAAGIPKAWIKWRGRVLTLTPKGLDKAKLSVLMTDVISSAQALGLQVEIDPRRSLPCARVHVAHTTAAAIRWLGDDPQTRMVGRYVIVIVDDLAIGAHGELCRVRSLAGDAGARTAWVSVTRADRNLPALLPESAALTSFLQALMPAATREKKLHEGVRLRVVAG